MKDRIFSKRKRRTAKPAETNQEAEEIDDNATASLIGNLIANIGPETTDMPRNGGELNDGFVNNEADENEDDPTKEMASQAIQSAVVNKHRDRSRELSKQMKDEDPNKVVEQLKDVREKIKDKIKTNLVENLAKVREDDKEETKTDDAKNDLKLDLTSTINDPNTLGQTLLSGTDNSLRERIRRIQVYLRDE